MADFKRKSESELSRLTDEALLGYVETARDAGDGEAAREGVGILGFRYWPRILGKVKARTPLGDVEDVAMTVMESIARSVFDGRHLGEFGSWVNTITARRIADYHDAANRQLPTTLLPDEHEGDESVWVSAGTDDDAIALFPDRELAEQVRAARKTKIHRDVVQLYGPVELEYNGLNARSTKAEIERLHPGETISEANIHQIWKRFRTDYAEARDASDLEGDQGADDG